MIGLDIAVLFWAGFMQLFAFLSEFFPAGNYRPELVKVLLQLGPATQLAELPTRYNDILTKRDSNRMSVMIVRQETY